MKASLALAPCSSGFRAAYARIVVGPDQLARVLVDSDEARQGGNVDVVFVHPVTGDGKRQITCYQWRRGRQVVRKDSQLLDHVERPRHPCRLAGRRGGTDQLRSDC